MKKLWILLIVASFSVLHANDNQDKHSKHYPPAPNLRGSYASDLSSQTSPHEKDQSLTSQIQRAVTAFFSGKYQDVSITLSKGQITLTGTVPSQEDKDTLERLFRGIYGVKGVNNQLTVKQE